VVECFSAVVPVYGTVVDFFDHFGARLVEVAEVGPGMRVLDIAAGKGSSARPAAASGADVLATDLTPEMVEVLRGHGLDARVMDGESLDLPDGSFDRVLCGFGLFFFPDPQRGVDEMRRVLKPGGRVALSIPLNPFPPEVLALIREYAPKAKGPAIPTPTPDFDAGPMMKAAGLADVEVLDEVHDFHFDSAEAVWRFVLTTLATDTLDRLSPEDRADIEARALQALGPGPQTVAMSARYWVASG
jgi:SAM-dependent methyltransferase